MAVGQGFELLYEQETSRTTNRVYLYGNIN
jgi:hypothetical protein